MSSRRLRGISLIIQQEVAESIPGGDPAYFSRRGRWRGER